MKRILVFMLLLISVCSLVACQTEPEPDVTYTISWYDENGTVIKTTDVKEGATPAQSYSVTDTDEWDYTFEGWSTTKGGEALNTIPAASENASYYAVVSKVKQKYTVSFNTGDGSAVEAQSIEYGSKATLPEEPTLEGYIFGGWYKDAEYTTEASFDDAVYTATTYYAKWNQELTVKAVLKALLSGYKMNPYSYLPEAMRPEYEANLVTDGDVVTDYSGFVNTSSIASHGFGEQWNMILSNFNQSQVFFNILSVVEGLTSTSIATFEQYIDKNPAETASYNFSSGIYNVTIDFDGEKMFYVLDYTANIPALGEQTIQIALSLEVESGEKTVRVQIGDANALYYSINENKYEFAIKYLGVRRAYFSVEEHDDGTKTGHIYEHLTVSSVGISSAADFYITDEYVSAVGNKADAFLGFKGYICEVYDVKTGRMLGYEVKETLSSINYDTLWFDLDCFTGINSIKAVENDGKYTFYVNGSSTPWANKKVGGISATMLSRRFDIELRTQYFYKYDAATESYVQVSALVPMLFVQEAYYDSLSDDVKSANSSITLSSLVDEDTLAKIKSDYSSYVSAFIETKDSMSSEAIIAFIGDKITFAK